MQFKLWYVHACKNSASWFKRHQSFFFCVDHRIQCFPHLNKSKIACYQGFIKFIMNKYISTQLLYQYLKKIKNICVLFGKWTFCFIISFNKTVTFWKSAVKKNDKFSLLYACWFMITMTIEALLKHRYYKVYKVSSYIAGHVKSVGPILTLSVQTKYLRY